MTSTPFQNGTPTGRVDMHGIEIRCGDIVRYNLEGSHTKKEYWNPEYRVIWRSPKFTLEHTGGGKPGDSFDFILTYGGTNGDLEIIEPWEEPGPLNKCKAWNDLLMFHALPPYDTGSNIVAGDGYFLKSFEKEHGMKMEEVEQMLGFGTLSSRFRSMKDRLATAILKNPYLEDE